MGVQHNNSVARAFAILDLFTEQRPQLSAGDVARALNLNTVTAHRFLRSLEAAGALVAVARGSYRLGFRLVDLANRVTRHKILAEAMQPALDELAAELNEASMAAVPEANAVICIATALPRRDLLVDIRPGMLMEAYCTAQGKLWLASLDDRALKAYLDEVPLDALTSKTITDREALVAEIRTIRREGFALNDGEREDGLRTIGLPLNSREGRMVAGVTVYGPVTRMTQEVLDTAKRLIGEALAGIDARLYGTAGGGRA
jgi:DNA-binding IclR family transcriptional regulator